MAEGFYLTPQDREVLSRVIERERVRRQNEEPTELALHQDPAPEVYIARPPCGVGIPPRVGDDPGYERCCLYYFEHTAPLSNEVRIEPLLDGYGEHINELVYNVAPEYIEETYIIIRRSKDGHWVVDEPLENSPTTTTSTTSTTTTLEPTSTTFEPEQDCAGRCKWTWYENGQYWTLSSDQCEYASTTTTSTTSTTSDPQTTTTGEPCICDIGSIHNPNTTLEPDCGTCTYIHNGTSWELSSTEGDCNVYPDCVCPGVAAGVGGSYGSVIDYDCGPPTTTPEPSCGSCEYVYSVDPGGVSLNINNNCHSYDWSECACPDYDPNKLAEFPNGGTWYQACEDYRTTTTTSTSTTPEPSCECLKPTYCGTIDGECVYTFCSEYTNEGPNCEDATSTTTTPDPSCDCDDYTSTTTQEPDPNCECNYIWTPVGWVAESTCCQGENCVCLPPEEDGSICESGGRCECSGTTSEPVEPCSGFCSWWWIPDLNRFFLDSSIGGCASVPQGCSCQSPSAPPENAECAQFETPCVSPTTQAPPTTSEPPHDPCAYCTSTTTTSTTPDPCGTECRWAWDGETWTNISSGCLGDCGCYPPEASGTDENCETARTYCQQTTTTTTTTTTPEPPCGSCTYQWDGNDWNELSSSCKGNCACNQGGLPDSTGLPIDYQVAIDCCLSSDPDCTPSTTTTTPDPCCEYVCVSGSWVRTSGPSNFCPDPFPGSCANGNAMQVDDCSTTTTTPDPCSGTCVYEWNSFSEEWEIASGGCATGCNCDVGALPDGTGLPNGVQEIIDCCSTTCASTTTEEPCSGTCVTECQEVSPGNYAWQTIDDCPSGCKCSQSNGLCGAGNIGERTTHPCNPLT